MVAQHGLGWLHSAEQRHRPRPRTRPAVRIADIRRQRVALVHFCARTLRLLARGSSLLRTRGLALLVAPLGIHKLAVVAIADVVAREIVPEKAGGRIVNVGLIVLQRIFVGDLALEIVGAFLAAIGDLPGLLVVVGSDRGGRPEMAVAGDLAAVVEIVEHSELQSEFVLVGSDVGAVHGERGIAVADFQIAEDLVVGAVFLDDVDHVLDRILAAGEIDCAGIAVKQVVSFDRLCEFGQLLSRVDGMLRRAIDPLSSVGM